MLSRRRLLLRITATFSFLLLMGIASSCRLNTDYFSDYNGKNLLSNWDFSKWSLTTSTSNPTPTDYMNWTDLGAGSGADGSSHAYNLEIKNLIPNGDFEASTAGISLIGNPVGNIYWSIVGAGTATVMSGKSLNWVGSTSDSLVLSLDSILGATIPVGSYQLQMDFVNLTAPTSLEIDYVDSTTSTTTTNWAAYKPQNGGDSSSHSLTAVTTVPAIIVSTSNQTHTINLVFANTQDAQNVLYDNMSLVRSDLPLSVTTSLSSLNSTSAQMIPGTYIFRVYVRDNTSSGGGNHFYASGLTVTIQAATQSGNTGTFTTFVSRSSSWSKTSWTLIQFNLGTVDFVDTDSQLGGRPALTVALSPTNEFTGSSSVAAGCLDVSQPVLEFTH